MLLQRASSWCSQRPLEIGRTVRLRGARFCVNLALGLPREVNLDNLLGLGHLSVGIIAAWILGFQNLQDHDKNRWISGAKSEKKDQNQAANGHANA